MGVGDVKRGIVSVVACLTIGACDEEPPTRTQTAPGTAAAPDVSRPAAGQGVASRADAEVGAPPEVQVRWAREEVSVMSGLDPDIAGRHRLVEGQRLAAEVKGLDGACAEALRGAICAALEKAPIGCAEPSAPPRTPRLQVIFEAPGGVPKGASLEAEVRINQSSIRVKAEYALRGTTAATCTEPKAAASLGGRLVRDWLGRVGEAAASRDLALSGRVSATRLPFDERPQALEGIKLKGGWADAFAEHLWIVRAFDGHYAVEVIAPGGGRKTVAFGAGRHGVAVHPQQHRYARPDPARKRLLFAVERFDPLDGAEASTEGALVVAVHVDGRASVAAELPELVRLSPAIADEAGRIYVFAGKKRESWIVQVGLDGKEAARWKVRRPATVGFDHDLFWLEPGVLAVRGSDEVLRVDVRAKRPKVARLWRWKDGGPLLLDYQPTAIADGAGGLLVMQPERRGEGPSTLRRVSGSGKVQWSARWEETPPDHVYLMGKTVLAVGGQHTHLVDLASGEPRGQRKYRVSSRPEASGEREWVLCAEPRAGRKEPAHLGQLRRMSDLGNDLGEEVALPWGCTATVDAGSELLAGVGWRGWYRVRDP